MGGGHVPMPLTKYQADIQKFMHLLIKSFNSLLPSTVKFLADLYMKGESTYVIKQNDKKTDVTVNRVHYQLSQEALEAFEAIHDDWELNICKKYPYDPLIGGKAHYISLYHFICMLYCKLNHVVLYGQAIYALSNRHQLFIC